MVSDFDGIGDAALALKLLDPRALAGHVATETSKVARALANRAQTGGIVVKDITDATEEQVRQCRHFFPNVIMVIHTSGPPCQGLSNFNVHRKGMADPRTSLLGYSVKIANWLDEQIGWSTIHVYENVQCMSREDRTAMASSRHERFFLP